MTMGRLPGTQVKRASRTEGAHVGQESFRTIANSMPELISYIGADQRYRFCNKSYEKWFGIPPKDFVGRRVREILGEPAYTVVRPCIEKALAGEDITYEGYVSYERVGKRYLRIDYISLKDERGKVNGFYVIIHDLTELKEAEEKYLTFLETTPDAMIVGDPQGKISMVNAQTERMFGYSRQELIGQRIEMLLSERFRDAHARDWEVYTKHPVFRTMTIRRDIYALRKDGSEFPIEISMSPLQTAYGAFISIVIRDVTVRKQLAEQIRWSAILEERSRLARDIHDSLAQGFTGIILNLEAVEEASTNLPEAAKERIFRARKVARESLEEARRSIITLSNEFSPGVNLATCLHGLVERYRSMSVKTQVTLSVQGKPFRLDSKVEENVCHIAQQATDNALQHADAKSIRIEIAFDEKCLRLRIRDDGQGFDVKRAALGFGLTGMRERAKQIGGEFNLRSRRGEGTSVEVKLALPAARREAAFS